MPRARGRWSSPSWCRLPPSGTTLQQLPAGASCFHRYGHDLAAETNQGAIMNTPDELSAGCIDVVPACAARGRDDAVRIEHIAETVNGLGRRAPVARSRESIERNEVDLRGAAT